MKSAGAILGIIALLVVLLLIGGCGSYNRLNTLKQQVDKSWADVQNVYQRRADLIPNLVRTVEGAANFEKSTLTDVIKARQQATTVKLDPNTAPTDPQALQRFQQTQDALSSALSRLMVVVERYPELKANANFQGLQAQLEGTENRIAVERRKYNEAVQGYNTTVNSMPTRLFAGMFGFHPHPYFAAREGADIAPEVNFNFGAPPAQGGGGGTQGAPTTPTPAIPAPAPVPAR
ncbi:LemA family protein [Verrucomicrobiota bacterium sgz303538]